MDSNRSLATLTADPKTWQGSSFISVKQISSDGLKLLFDVSQSMRKLVRTLGGNDSLKHIVVANVFYEASTRTACSFEAATVRLGGSSIHIDGETGNSSAAKKGESLEDTCRCLACYADVIVLRHPIEGSVSRVAQFTEKPVINAGDGIGEHPTQALLDIFTIYDELKIAQLDELRPLTIVLLGDLKNGRTVHSLATLLCTSGIWKGKLTLRYCSPNGLEMPSYVAEYCERFGESVVQETCCNLKDACIDADVLYVTRIQSERFKSSEEYEKVKGSYVVDDELMKQAPSNMVVLHPLPRVDEISTSVDRDPRAAYFRQMENGMFVRMALLSLLIGSRPNRE